jgi:hypothetical protein
MIPLTLQILLPCYFATTMTIASERLSASLFDSNWNIEPQKFKTTMMIFMERSKALVKFKSFGFFEVNLEKFLYIMNSVYSMYAVLKNVSVDKNV